VKFRVGLRAEIIVNIMFLMGAALFFVGVLFIRFTEKEILAQKIACASTLGQTLAGVFGERFGDKKNPGFQVNDLSHIFRSVTTDLKVEGWVWTRSELYPFGRSHGSDGFDEKILNQVRKTGEMVIIVRYPSVLPFFKNFPESFLTVTAPINDVGNFNSALQLRISLLDVRDRVHSAYKIMFLYVFLYGLILTIFGLYFLNSTVVKPICKLQALAKRIASGALDQSVPSEGPKEIVDLANDLNSMALDLKKSQLQSLEHIAALEKANNEIRKTQAELIHSEKMASIGHLAAGMAHEIGNPLGAIVGYLGYLNGELLAGPQKDILERSLAEASRIDHLVRELLDFAAPSNKSKVVFNPIEAVREALDILEAQGSFDGLKVEKHLPILDSKTSMSRQQLVQVFVNLMLNARDASFPDGVLSVYGGDELEYIWVSVKDVGCGMDKEVLCHIFDPFYTTKSPDKGRGLGLAICQRVVTEAGGIIEVNSVVGKGSEFTVKLKKVEG